MKYLEPLRNWFIKFRRYVVTYKGGFFQLVNVANSPAAIVESFAEMPFCKIDRNNRQLTSNTAFIVADTYYLELDNGLWLLISDLLFKKNVTITNIYEKSIPAEYNILNLQFYERTLKHKSSLVSGAVLSDKTWVLFKAGKASVVHHFKDAHQYNITIYFTDDWLSRQKEKIKDNLVADFLQSEHHFITWPDRDITNKNLYLEFLNLVKLSDKDLRDKPLYDLVISFFHQFINKHKQEVTSENYFMLSDKDYKNIQKVEKHLLDNLLVSFPGVEAIAKEVGISATKLKNDFKTIHRLSLFQYYRFHQMNLAYTLISKKESTIKEIATLFGYDNPSKFTAAFKEQHGVLPSEI
jgi:AraC-like DNA-binding protein